MRLYRNLQQLLLDIMLSSKAVIMVKSWERPSEFVTNVVGLALAFGTNVYSISISTLSLAWEEMVLLRILNIFAAVEMRSWIAANVSSPMLVQWQGKYFPNCRSYIVPGLSFCLHFLYSCLQFQEKQHTPWQCHLYMWSPWQDPPDYVLCI